MRNASNISDVWDAAAHTNPRHHRGFTLIELLIVLGIIAALVGLSVFVGKKVVDGGKEKQTKDTLIALEAIIASYASASDTGPVPPGTLRVPDPNSAGNFLVFPVVDGVVKDAMGMEFFSNSLGLFFIQCKDVKEAADLVKGLPAKTVRGFDSQDYSRLTNRTEHPLVGVFDAWGNPIRFVHPAFDGVLTDDRNGTSFDPAAFRSLSSELGTLPPNVTPAYRDFRRNHVVATSNPPSPGHAFPDSDGGVVVGQRPYVYSAGPDGKVGYLIEQGTNPPVIIADYNADNIYITVPKINRPK